MSLLFLLALSLSVAPQACIQPPLDDPEPRRARWHTFLPLVVVGVDLRPQQRVYFQEQTLFHPDQVSLGPAVDHLHTDALTRWVVGLRWTSAPKEQPFLPTSVPALDYCEEWILLRAHRPSTLAQAIDHWSRRATLAALLEPRGGKR